MVVSRVRRSKRWVRWLAFAVGAALVAVVAFWAGRTVAPPDLSQPTDSVELYEVVEGTVGQSLSMAARIDWTPGPSVAAPASGTVTAISTPVDRPVVSGDILYQVDLQPVVAIAGEVPAFRDLAEGSVGPDVRQLQEHLAAQGFFSGSADGRFSAATRAAVTSWQEEIGASDDGVVNLGEVVFLALPARAYLSEQIIVGSLVSAGSVVLETVVGEPNFFLLPSSDGAVTAAVPDVSATVTFGSTIVSGVTGMSSRLVDGTTVVPVEAVDGVLCDDACIAAVPVPGPLDVAGELLVAAEQTGPVVPVSAIVTSPTGQTLVVRSDGRDQAVTVLVSFGGLAVVEGVDVGDQVRLFGES